VRYVKWRARGSAGGGAGISPPKRNTPLGLIMLKGGKGWAAAHIESQ